ncbi:MAG: hypothetical protein WAO76_17735 [Georgfuchsia sp.]
MNAVQQAYGQMQFLGVPLGEGRKREHEPHEDDYWGILPRPPESVIRRWDYLTTDERIEAAFPGPLDHRQWSQDEKDIYIVRLCALLVEDMETTFANHQARDANGKLVFSSAEGKEDFVYTLGWAIGAWPGRIPCETVLKLFNIDWMRVRYATIARYEKNLYLIRDLARKLFPEQQPLALH